MTSHLETTRPAAVTAYLRRATWGLPRAQQQALWDELEEHLLNRAEHLELGGLSPTHALLQATRELGPPSRVTLGMTQVYAMPKLLIAAATAALALSAALYALAGGSGGGVITLPVLTRLSPTTLCSPDDGTTLQFPVDSRRSGQICYRVAATTKSTGALVSVSAITPALQSLGITISVLPDGKLEIRMPDGTWSRGSPASTLAGQPYMFASSLVGSLIRLRPRSKAEETVVSGFSNPVLRISGTTIRFNAVSDAQIGGNLYSDITGEAINALFYPREDQGHTFDNYFAPDTAPQHRLQTQLAPGEVVALVQRDGENRFSTDVAEVRDGGQVTVHSASTQLRFVSSSALVRAPKAGEPTAAMLVRLSNIPLNQLKTGIVLPAQTTSDAR